MNLRRLLILRSAFPTAALALTLAACASAPSQSAPPARVEGGMLVGAANGMTLYVFDKDEAGTAKSACNGPCANNWPPLTAAPDDKPAGDYAIMTREDGRRQWCYKGKPLYYWVKDQKPGDTTGDGFNKVWHVAR